jgi:N-acetylglucosaminyldiphosphoundecaprenol N-acetyl-beta-D-mannosaminyltransferase
MPPAPRVAPISGYAKIRRVKIGHALVHAASFRQALDLLMDHARAGRSTAHVVTPNAQHIVILESDAHFRHAYENATLVLPDGSSLLMAARILASRLKERVTGVDLFQSLCGCAADEGLSVFLLGGKPGSAEAAAMKLKSLYPKLNVAGLCCPSCGFEKDPLELQEVARQIRFAAPHFLFVGLGAPKQERWIDSHGTKLGVPVCVGVGGSFEMVGGFTRRAPQWMQAASLEWLFRLTAEPRRLWKRYLIGNLQFMAIVFRQWFHSKWTCGRRESERRIQT